MSGSFGENVRKRRLELGMTLKEVAARMDMSRQAVDQIERGHNRPHENTVDGYCYVLKEAGYVCDLRTGRGGFVRDKKKLNALLTSAFESVD